MSEPHESVVGEPLHQKNDLQSRFNDWIYTHPAEADRLEIPMEYWNLLVPQRAREIALQPSNLKIINLERDYIVRDYKPIYFALVETDYPNVLTPEDQWLKWLEKNNQIQKLSNSINWLPPFPKDMDRLHAELYNDLIAKRIDIKDRIIFFCFLSIFEENPQILRVERYNGETHKGIAKQFYGQSLPEFAKSLGFRFISGVNNTNNINFFKNKLGRVNWFDIKKVHRNFFFPGASTLGITANELHTIQFLYPEDRKIYVKEDLKY